MLEPIKRSSQTGGTDQAENCAAKFNNLRAAIRITEEQVIRETIQRNHWHLSKVANELKISRTTLYNRLKRYGIKRKLS